MKFSKKVTIAVIALIVVLIISNPSYIKFKNYSQEFNVDGVHINCKQTFNGFLFSVYAKEVAQAKWPNGSHIVVVRYLGILSNFFELSRSNQDIQNYHIIENK